MKSKLSLSLISLLLLQACGGGGGSDSAVPPAQTGLTPSTPSTPSQPAATITPFVAGAAPRYSLLSVGLQAFGRLDAPVQASTGAMSSLGGSVLSADGVTKDIHGDASFAMGRWTQGTVTRGGSTSQITSSQHYLAYNALSALPASGTPSCDIGVFTTPTDHSDSAKTGVSTGSVTLAFDATGAKLVGEIQVTAESSVGKVSLNTTLSSPSSVGVTGNYLSQKPGAAVQLGANGSNAYLVATSFIATTAAGKSYNGAAVFRCK